MGFIHITLDRTLAEEFRDKAAELPQRFQETLDLLKEDYGINISIYTPVRDGFLVANHEVVDTGLFGFYFDNSMVYYPYVILGTAPHIIEGNPWLYWEGADHPVRRVQHPGTAPNDYMEMAFDATDSDVDARLDDLLGWVVE